MKITSVNVHKKNDDSRMKGIASVLLDDCFVVRDIRIIEGKDGLFIAMPSRKNADGEYHNDHASGHPSDPGCYRKRRHGHEGHLQIRGESRR